MVKYVKFGTPMKPFHSTLPLHIAFQGHLFSSFFSSLPWPSKTESLFSYTDTPFLEVWITNFHGSCLHALFASILWAPEFMLNLWILTLVIHKTGTFKNSASRRWIILSWIKLLKNCIIHTTQDSRNKIVMSTS